MTKFSNKILVCCLAMIFAVSFLFAACSKGKEKDPGGDGSSAEIKDTDIVLAENGQTDYSIVIPAEADECVRYAAEELTVFFEEATGAQIATVSDYGKTFNENDKVISLDETTIKIGSGLKTEQDELNVDGFKIKRFGKTVVIDGVQTQGTLYGVYEFLSRQFAFEPYLVDEIYLNKVTKSYVKDYDFSDEPDFIGRDYDALATNSAQFIGRLRGTSRHQYTERYGDSSTFYKFLGVPYHSFDDILPRSEYQEEHPDWYKDSTKQICLTYEERKGITCDDEDSVVGAYAREMQERILSDEHHGYVINMSENDMSGYCLCETCRAKKAEAGGYQSALYINFANKVIEVMEAWKKTVPELADVELEYYICAYSSQTLYAPVKSDGKGGYVPTVDWAKPNEKLGCIYIPIGACFYHSFFDQNCSRNKNYAIEWERWHYLCEDFGVYDYNTCYNEYLPFFDNFNVRQDLFRDYYEGGVKYLTVQSTTGQKFSSMSDLKVYLEHKMMWNVYEDVPTLIENFMTNVYKDAAPYMTEYFNLLRSNMKVKEQEFLAEEKEFHLDMYSGTTYQYTTEIYTKPLVDRLQELLDQAYNAFNGVSDPLLRAKLQQRIVQERFCLQYIILTNYGQYYDITSQAYADMVLQWEKDAMTLGASVYKEWNGPIGLLIDQFKSKISV